MIQPGMLYDDLQAGEEIGMIKSDDQTLTLKRFATDSCVPCPPAARQLFQYIQKLRRNLQCPAAGAWSNQPTVI
jgi:hypothetical protein